MSRATATLANKYLRDGFNVHPDQLRIDRGEEKKKKARNGALADNAPVCVHWGKPTIDSLKRLVYAVEHLHHFDAFEEKTMLTLNQEGATKAIDTLKVRFTIDTNGLLALGSEGASHRKHSAILPTADLTTRLNAIPGSLKSPYTGPISSGKARVVAAGVLYLHTNKGQTKIVGISNRSGHYRFGVASLKFTQCYLQAVCPEALGSTVKHIIDAKTIRIIGDAQQRCARTADLTQDPTFAQWLQDAHQNMTTEAVIAKATRKQLRAQSAPSQQDTTSEAIPPCFGSASGSSSHTVRLFNPKGGTALRAAWRKKLAAAWQPAGSNSLPSAATAAAAAAAAHTPQPSRKRQGRTLFKPMSLNNPKNSKDNAVQCKKSRFTPQTP